MPLVEKMVSMLTYLLVIIIPGVWAFRHDSLHRQRLVKRNGWLEDLFQPRQSATSTSRLNPEQYPATTSKAALPVVGDKGEALKVRPLLAGTQLERRKLEVVYRATRNGWCPENFHGAVDSKGAAVVVATTTSGLIVGGYNPKGWASLGGARPSVAAFLFVSGPDKRNESDNDLQRATNFIKLPKVGGGGLAISTDDPGFGVSFGPDSLVIPLKQKSTRARSKLGTYFQVGPNGERSLFDFAPTSAANRGEQELAELVVLVGVYEPGEDIPYTGAVLDMTSG